jgi:hypothetical protein
MIERLTPPEGLAASPDGEAIARLPPQAFIVFVGVARDG